jgi:hypothetical protein
MMARTATNFGLRRVLLPVLAIAAPVVGQIHELTGAGVSIRDFTRQGDEIIRAANWAFAIWGPIYLGLIVYAFAQVRMCDGPAILNRLAWPSTFALAGIGGWVLAAQFGGDLLTPILIIGSAAILIAPLWAAGATQDGASLKHRGLIVWPLAALAGWLTIAAPLNVVGMLARAGVAQPGQALIWGAVGIVLALTVGVVVTLRTRLIAYPVPISWGLFAVFMAERIRDPALGWLALAASLALLVVTAVKARR